MVYKHPGKESFSGNVPPCCQRTNMGCRRRFKDYLKDLMVNSVKGEKLLSYQISLIVGDPLFLTPLLEAGKLEEARQASKVIIFSLFAILLFCLCLLILIFNFNLDLHIFPSRWCFHRLPPSPGNCCPLWWYSTNMNFCPDWFGPRKKRVSVLIWWSV